MSPTEPGRWLFRWRGETAVYEAEVYEQECPEWAETRGAELWTLRGACEHSPGRSWDFEVANPNIEWISPAGEARP